MSVQIGQFRAVIEEEEQDCLLWEAKPIDGFDDSYSIWISDMEGYEIDGFSSLEDFLTAYPTVHTLKFFDVSAED